MTTPIAAGALPAAVGAGTALAAAREQSGVEAVPADQAPVAGVEVAEDYVIGVEDVLYVSVWKNPRDLVRDRKRC